MSIFLESSFWLFTCPESACTPEGCKYQSSAGALVGYEERETYNSELHQVSCFLPLAGLCVASQNCLMPIITSFDRQAMTHRCFYTFNWEDHGALVGYI